MLLSLVYRSLQTFTVSLFCLVFSSPVYDKQSQRSYFEQVCVYSSVFSCMFTSVLDRPILVPRSPSHKHSGDSDCAESAVQFEQAMKFHCTVQV